MRWADAAPAAVMIVTAVIANSKVLVIYPRSRSPIVWTLCHVALSMVETFRAAHSVAGSAFEAPAGVLGINPRLRLVLLGALRIPLSASAKRGHSPLELRWFGSA